MKTFVLLIFLTLPLFVQAQDKIETESIPGNVSSSSQDVRPIISDDGKKLYINRRFHPENMRGTKDFQDVWVSTYDSRGVWTKPKNLGEKYNDKKANDLVRASKNDDSLVFVNTKYKGINSELALFIKGKDPVDLNIDGFYNKSPYVDFDYNFKHRVILMAVERKDSEGDQDLYYSVYQETSQTFSTPMTMGESINSAKADFAPFLTNDGNTLFFASYGHGGQGSSDLFMTHRKGDGWDEWTKPENLGSVINSKFEETFVSIDPSFDYLYYDSYPSGSTNRNIWRATLSDEIKNKIIAARESHRPKETIRTPIIEETPQETAATEETVVATIAIPEKEVTEPSIDVKNKEQEVAQVIEEKQQPETVVAVQPDPVTINQEMDYKAELEAAKETGLLQRIGRKLGMGGNNKEIELINGGTKGQKINRNIYFQFDSDKLQNQFDKLLDQIASKMEMQSQIKILLEGHTDGIGGEDVNKDLSCRRANIIKDQLIERGINAARIEISCEGKERPIASNDDEFEGRELNRRVEFYLF